MANVHRYGLRFLKNRWGGDTPETEVVRIASAYSPSNGSVTCNLNIGDPVYLDDSGNANLLVAGSTTTADDQVTQRAYGVVVGFPQVLINGAVRPNGTYPAGTTYGSAYNARTLATVIPVPGVVWEIDTNAAGGSSRDTRAEFENVVGGCAHIVYSALGTGTTNVRANPLFDIANITQAVANFRQLRVVGVGRLGDAIDFESTNVPLQVVFNFVQQSPWRTTAGFDGS